MARNNANILSYSFIALSDSRVAIGQNQRGRESVCTPSNRPKASTAKDPAIGFVCFCIALAHFISSSVCNACACEIHCAVRRQGTITSRCIG